MNTGLASKGQKDVKIFIIIHLCLCIYIPKQFRRIATALFITSKNHGALLIIRQCLFKPKMWGAFERPVLIILIILVFREVLRNYWQ